MSWFKTAADHTVCMHENNHLRNQLKERYATIERLKETIQELSRKLGDVLTKRADVSRNEEQMVTVAGEVNRLHRKVASQAETIIDLMQGNVHLREKLMEHGIKVDNQFDYPDEGLVAITSKVEPKPKKLTAGKQGWQPDEQAQS